VTETALEERLSAPLAELLAGLIPRTAAKAHRRCKTIPAEDYEQAMWVRVLSKPDRYRRYLDEGRGGLIQLTLYRACADLTREDRRYRLAVKAASDGYSAYDIEFYSVKMLRLLLPALVEADFDPAAAMDRAASSTDAAGVHIRSSDPFGGAENYLVVLVDVAAAYRRLPEGMQRLLRTYYGVSQDDTEDGRWDREKLASSMGLTAEALKMRVHRALQRLQDELGGSDPWT
jgi:DNA-directed RNA polymerase specialized sigma24 family protein